MIILRFLGEIMAGILALFYSIYPDYGLGIVLLTFLLRLVLFPTAISQVRSMEGMKIVQPKIKEIQDKYRDKPEEMNRRMLEIYREHKINPLGGCLPLLIQMPFILALFGLLQKPETYGIILKDKAFLGLLLTAKGSAANLAGSIGNLVLAALSGATTYIQTKMTSPSAAAGASTDSSSSMQNTFLYIMPIMLAWFTFSMPAAIGIYWVSQNVFGIIQQYVIVKYFIPKNPQEQDEPARNRTRPKGR